MKLTRHKRDFGVFCAAMLLAAQQGHAGRVDSQNEHVRAQIVAESQSIQPGTPFWLGVRFEIQHDWHLNWINPGDAGLAPSVQWDLPDGFTASEIAWPYPTSYRIGPLVIYGYDTDLLLISRVTPPADLPKQGRVEIGAKVDWLACADACVPGGARLTSALPVRPSHPLSDSRWQGLFEETKRAHPVPSTDWTVEAFVEDDERYTLEVRSNNPNNNAVAGCRFYPLAPDVIDHAQPQQFAARAGGFDLTLMRAQMSTEIPSRLSGVLVADPGWDRSGERRAISIDIPMGPR